MMLFCEMTQSRTSLQRRCMNTEICLNLYGKLYLIIKIAFTDFINSYIYIVIHLKERS